MKTTYQKTAVPKLKEKFGYKNPMATPKIEKVTLNTSFGKLAAGKTTDEQRKIAESIQNDLSLVAGQRAVLTKARKSISGFKLREGMPIGVKATLRGAKMYDFLERLVNIVLPRSRDFQGIKRNCVDQEGNLNLGMKEHIFFPEISPEQSRVPFGLEVSVTTTAKSKEEGLALLRALGFPFISDSR